jgi:hypothetical protein
MQEVTKGDVEGEWAKEQMRKGRLTQEMKAARSM